MSATITSATWANSGTSGNWTDPTQWTPASVPGATNNVLIGSAVSNTAAPWTVTVAGAQAANNLTLEMGSSAAGTLGGPLNGTLSITGALSVAGTASLGYGTIGGAQVDLGTGASFSAGAMVAESSTFLVNGGTITTGSFADLDAASAVIQNNGVWNGDALFIGQFFTTHVTVGAAGTLAATGAINVGTDGTTAKPFSEGIGSLIATGGGLISAATLSVVNGSLLKVDSLSAADVGGAPSAAGAVAIGSGGLLALESASVFANVVDNGALTVLVNPNAASTSVGSVPVISGALTGNGTLHIGGSYTLELGAANGFAGAITIDPNAELLVATNLPPTGAISMSGGTLALQALTFGSGQTLNYTSATGLLTVGGDTLNVGAGLSPARFSVAADATTPGAGTLIMETACYAAGTRIAGAHGEVAVEALRPGDRVRTAGGRLAPVRWVGQTTRDVRRHEHAAPVRIVAGAFAPGVPRRDLLVSNDHAIAVGGVLIPAGKLVNGATIRTDRSFAAVTYVHVELDRHDLLLAEGLAAESFLDTGNRGQFFGATTAAPRFDTDPEAAALRIFAERGCAKLVLRGPLVAAAQARLRGRAAALGWRLLTDAGLTVEADAGTLRAVAAGPDALRAVVAPGAQQVRLLSRSFVPAVLDAAEPDHRHLGAALAVELDGVRPDAAAFASGWHRQEEGTTWRWTDGAATLALPARAHPSVLTVQVMQAGARYWVQQPAAARAA